MSGWRVPLTDLKMPEQDVEAVLETLRSGWLTMGPRTDSFETALAAYTGAPHVMAVSSGTAALHLACLACGIGPGDEVIVPALTFVASASAARYAGASPVLCDVAPHGCDAVRELRGITPACQQLCLDVQPCLGEPLRGRVVAGGEPAVGKAGHPFQSGR